MHIKPPAADTALPLRLYLFATFRLEGTFTFHLPRRKVKALLAYLVLHDGPHSREELAALLWGDTPDLAARASLRTALSVLRRQLGADLLLIERETIQLNPEFSLWTDVREFEQLLSQAERSIRIPPTNAAPPPDLWLRPAALYRGDLLADFYDEWIVPLREEFRTRYIHALLYATEQLRAQSEYGRALEVAGTVLTYDPANERAHQHMMFCYVVLGKRQAALEHYEQAKRALEAELAIEPARETTALYNWIRQASLTVPSQVAQITNLPIPLSSFIGREREIRALRRLFTDNRRPLERLRAGSTTDEEIGIARQSPARLVTLTGAGGSGKTRLAVRVATELIDIFPDGVWWVDLAALMDETLVPQTVGKALGIQELAHQSLTDSLIHFMDTKRLLLLIDNCEHLINSCAHLVSTLLTHCPNLKILATSRERLNLIGEVVYLVPTLSVPQAKELSLVELFAAV